MRLHLSGLARAVQVGGFVMALVAFGCSKKPSVSQSKVSPPPTQSTTFDPPIPPPTISQINVRTKEIEKLISLFDSKSIEQIEEALNIMEGGQERKTDPKEVREQWVTVALYTQSVGVVLRDGTEAEKDLISRLLIAIARACPIEKTRTKLNLWGMLATEMGETSEDGTAFWKTPPEQMEQWLLRSSIFSKLRVKG
jgi:hypothetical protein